jgi:hypothetical protein
MDLELDRSHTPKNFRNAWPLRSVEMDKYPDHMNERGQKDRWISHFEYNYYVVCFIGLGDLQV